MHWTLTTVLGPNFFPQWSTVWSQRHHFIFLCLSLLKMLQTGVSASSGNCEDDGSASGVLRTVPGTWRTDRTSRSLLTTRWAGQGSKGQNPTEGLCPLSKHYALSSFCMSGALSEKTLHMSAGYQAEKHISFSPLDHFSLSRFTSLHSKLKHVFHQSSSELKIPHSTFPWQVRVNNWIHGVRDICG